MRWGAGAPCPSLFSVGGLKRTMAQSTENQTGRRPRQLGCPSPLFRFQSLPPESVLLFCRLSRGRRRAYASRSPGPTRCAPPWRTCQPTTGWRGNGSDRARAFCAPSRAFRWPNRTSDPSGHGPHRAENPQTDRSSRPPPGPLLEPQSDNADKCPKDAVFDPLATSLESAQESSPLERSQTNFWIERTPRRSAWRPRD